MFSPSGAALIRFMRMTPREKVLEALNGLSEPELDAVAHIAAALHARHLPAGALDPAVYGPLYQEFGSGDRALAEEGMSDFTDGLAREDDL
jgi:hypothetical protein